MGACLLGFSREQAFEGNGCSQSPVIPLNREFFAETPLRPPWEVSIDRAWRLDLLIQYNQLTISK